MENMTFTDTYLELAVKALEDGRLNKYETLFITDIRDCDKKELRRLPKPSLLLLQDIANKNI